MSLFKDFRDRFMLLDLFAGLSITLRNMAKKKVTVQYPEQRREPAARFRGMFRLDEERCIKCTICFRDCPIDIIYIDWHSEKNEAAIHRICQPGPKTEVADWYGRTILPTLWRLPPKRFTSQAFWDCFDRIRVSPTGQLGDGADELDQAQLRLLAVWKQRPWI